MSSWDQMDHIGMGDCLPIEIDHINLPRKKRHRHYMAITIHLAICSHSTCISLSDQSQVSALHTLNVIQILPPLNIPSFKHSLITFKYIQQQQH